MEFSHLTPNGSNHPARKVFLDVCVLTNKFKIKGKKDSLMLTSLIAIKYPMDYTKNAFS